MDKIKVLIVGGYDLFRKGLWLVLESAGDIEVVGEANGEWVAKKACELLPDVILINVETPKRGKLEIVSLIKNELPEANIVLLIGNSECEYVVEAVKRGAIGYVLAEDISVENLVNVIKRTSRGEAFAHPNAIKKLFHELAYPSPADSSNEILTKREKDVLQLIINGKANKEIAGELSIGVTTVKSFIRKIFKKLEVANRAQAASEALRSHLLE